MSNTSSEERDEYTRATISHRFWKIVTTIRYYHTLILDSVKADKISELHNKLITENTDKNMKLFIKELKNLFELNHYYYNVCASLIGMNIESIVFLRFYHSKTCFKENRRKNSLEFILKVMLKKIMDASKDNTLFEVEMDGVKEGKKQKSTIALQIENEIKNLSDILLDNHKHWVAFLTKCMKDFKGRHLFIYTDLIIDKFINIPKCSDSINLTRDTMHIQYNSDNNIQITTKFVIDTDGSDKMRLFFNDLIIKTFKGNLTNLNCNNNNNNNSNKRNNINNNLSSNSSNNNNNDNNNNDDSNLNNNIDNNNNDNISNNNNNDNNNNDNSNLNNDIDNKKNDNSSNNNNNDNNNNDNSNLNNDIDNNNNDNSNLNNSIDNNNNDYSSNNNNNDNNNNDNSNLNNDIDNKKNDNSNLNNSIDNDDDLTVLDNDGNIEINENDLMDAIFSPENDNDDGELSTDSSIFNTTQITNKNVNDAMDVEEVRQNQPSDIGDILFTTKSDENGKILYHSATVSFGGSIEPVTTHYKLLDPTSTPESIEDSFKNILKDQVTKMIDADNTLENLFKELKHINDIVRNKSSSVNIDYVNLILEICK